MHSSDPQQSLEGFMVAESSDSMLALDNYCYKVIMGTFQGHMAAGNNIETERAVRDAIHWMVENPQAENAEIGVIQKGLEDYVNSVLDYSKFSGRGDMD
mmetsp:Transcript_82839/g.242876  ORF Transcript_82839/g.242876 Transcript_82839/m.242876 type:complete len:99 (-) Transcript_82839:170-466(-)